MPATVIGDHSRDNGRLDHHEGLIHQVHTRHGVTMPWTAPFHFLR